MSTRTLCLLQGTFEKVIVLEYKRQIDDKMNTHHMDSSTYGDICRFNVTHFGTQEHSEVYVYGRDDDMIKDMERKDTERNNSIPLRERT
jgi:hypothetical protein